MSEARSVTLVSSSGDPLPRPGHQTIYNIADVDQAAESVGKRNEGLQAWYGKMRRLGGQRCAARPASCDVIDGLYAKSPNFSPVIDDLRKWVALTVFGNGSMEFMPTLLLGEPGLGKTYFAKRLAQVLGTGFTFVSMNSLTAGWILTGASAQWSNARPGKVAQTLIEGDYANPVVVLDELDKVGGDHRYDPMGALYTLLERDTAQHFRDEFIDVDMDASHILWIATANDETMIPEPILNRMNVYEIGGPDEEGSRRIAREVYREILGEHTWTFREEPSEAVIDKLSLIPPRDMKKLLLDAFGTAQLAGRDELSPDDLRPEKLSGSKRRVGF